MVVPANAPAIAVDRYHRYRLQCVEQSQFNIFMGIESGMELEWNWNGIGMWNSLDLMNL